MIQILTLTWNGLDKMKALHDGLARNIDNVGEEVIWYVRDNGSKDDTVKWLKEYDGPINIKTLIKDHNRDNFAQGVNSLAEMAREDWRPKVIVKGRSVGATSMAAHAASNKFMFLNNDIVFGDDVSLKKMNDLYKSNSDIGMVGARLLYNDTNKLQHAGVIFSKQYGLMPYHYRHGEESDKAAEQNRYFQAVTAACSLLCAEKFFEVGCLDQKFSWAFEDIDLCLKFNETKRIAQCGKTKIFHEESASLKKNPVNKYKLNIS